MADVEVLRRPRRAIIVGAGIAGLSAAYRLRQSNWNVLVVERAPRLRGGGYLLAFLGIGYDAAERMGLLEALKDKQAPAAELRFADAAGRPYARVPADVHEKVRGRRTLTLLRGDLEGLLHDAVSDSVDIRFGTTVDNIATDDDGVTVRLSDGREERADLLIGADGVHSAVRASTFGPEQEFRVDMDHYAATYLLNEAPDDVEPGTLLSLDLVGRTAGVHRLSDNCSAAFFYFHASKIADNPDAGPSAAVRTAFGDLGWAVPDLLNGMDLAESIYFDRTTQISMPRWSEGRVALLGDAAWCVSLFAGYGASLAVAGAEALGDALDATGDDIPAALRQWEQQLRPTVDGRQRKARRAVAIFVIPNARMLRLRRLSLRLSTSRFALGLIRRFGRRPKQPAATG